SAATPAPSPPFAGAFTLLFASALALSGGVLTLLPGCEFFRCLALLGRRNHFHRFERALPAFRRRNAAAVFSLFLPGWRRDDMRAGNDLLHALGIFFFLEEEVRHIQERVAFQSHIDERRLHAGKHAGHPAFVNRSSQGVFIFALVIDFR